MLRKVLAAFVATGLAVPGAYAVESTQMSINSSDGKDWIVVDNGTDTNSGTALHFRREGTSPDIFDPSTFDDAFAIFGDGRAAAAQYCDLTGADCFSVDQSNDRIDTALEIWGSDVCINGGATCLSAVGSAGEANDGANLGGGAEIFISKSGVNLQFRTITASSSKVTVVENVGANQINIDVNPAQINLSQLGTKSITDLDDEGALASLDTVDTAEIEDDAVTYTKIQNVSATDRILGRDSSGAGSVEEITPANLLTMLGVEAGATADQTDSEIETAYNNQVAQVSGGEITAGTESAVRRYSPADIKAFVDQHSSAIAFDGDLDGDVLTDTSDNVVNVGVDMSLGGSDIGLGNGGYLSHGGGDFGLTFDSNEVATFSSNIANGTRVTVSGADNDPYLSLVGGAATNIYAGVSTAAVTTPPSGSIFLDQAGALYVADGANTWQQVNTGNSGETNTASNVGTAGVGVFKQKNGVDFEFKKINAASSKVTVADDTGSNEVDIDIDPAQINLSQLGTKSITDLDDEGALASLDTVDTAEIEDDAVTYTKIQNVSATDRILGRDSSGAGSVEEITPANLLTMLGVEAGATADQTDSEIETAYNNQVAQVSGGEITAGSETAVRRYSPADIKSFIDTHGAGADNLGDGIARSSIQLSNNPSDTATQYYLNGDDTAGEGLAVNDAGQVSIESPGLTGTTQLLSFDTYNDNVNFLNFGFFDGGSNDELELFVGSSSGPSVAAQAGSLYLSSAGQAFLKTVDGGTSGWTEIPLTDNDTTYTAGTGLSLAADEFSIDGTVVTSNYTGSVIISGAMQATQYTSTVSTGTAPMTIASTTLVSNLNADLLDGQEGAYYLDNTDAQDLTLVGNTLAVSGDPNTDVDLSGYLDNTDSQTLGLNSSNNVISISGGNNIDLDNVNYLTGLLTLKEDNGTTNNTVADVLALETTTTNGANGADGLGVGLSFLIENDNDESEERGAIDVSFVTGGAANGDEEAKMSFLLAGGGSGAVEERGYLLADGDLYLDGATHLNGAGQTSDVRLKENIEELVGALDRIKELRGVTFDWKEGRYKGEHHVGLVAQEVENIFPSAVMQGVDGYKYLNYSVLVSPLIEAVKELDSENQTLKNQLANLEQRLLILENNQ